MDESFQILTSKYGEPLQPPQPQPARVRVLDTVIYLDLGEGDTEPRIAIEREKDAWVIYIHGSDHDGDATKIVCRDQQEATLCVGDGFDVVN